MYKVPADHTLEFLLAFDGRRHWYERGYCLKFEIKRIEPTSLRPHGLRYSFTLHDPTGKRLIGFDNAHAVRRSRRTGNSSAADHWHSTRIDAGRPYLFKSADALLEDFFREAELMLMECGVPLDVVTTEDRGDVNEIV